MSQYSFSNVPIIKHRRSQFDLSHIVKTSGNVGTLYPLDVQEVYPGDSIKTDLSIVSRLTSTFLKPVIDNLFLDVYHFFVPSRILYDKWKNIFGENTQSAWANTSEYDVPLVYGSYDDAKLFDISPKTVGDYLGLPVSSDGSPISQNVPVSVLPFRAFAKVYEDWFRDQNNVSPMHIQTGETVSSESPNNNPWAPNNYLGQCPKVAKLHDYFTSCLPAPQKLNEPVPIPLSADYAPVITRDQDVYLSSFGQTSLSFGSVTESPIANPSTLGLVPTGSSTTIGNLRAYPSGASGTPNFGVVPLNLWADVSKADGSISVSDLRLATQTQRILERDARSGSRYIEYLRTAFGVSAPNAELQRSEFLGGKRIPISITQVTQTTGSNNDISPLADVGAYSLSGGRTRYNKGFTEHGYVLTVFCVRQFHTYQQGIERFWTRHKRFDFYDPAFANLSEQPVYKSELFAFGESYTTQRQVFGYQEAWADLRCRQNKITGQLRSAAADKLDMWHFGDYYANAPTLNADFIEETPQYVDRAITVESIKQDQFLFDFYFKTRAYRALPVYSVPGLVDHN